MPVQLYNHVYKYMNRHTINAHTGIISVYSKDYKFELANL